MRHTHNNQPIVVLGRGYVGSMVEAMLSCTHQQHYAFARKQLDYHDEKQVRAMLRRVNPKAVIMAFGFTGNPNVDACQDEPELTYWLNSTVPAMVAGECASAKVHCIALSTGCIFDGYEKAYTERDAPNNGLNSSTASLYCRSKHDFEQSISHWPVSVVRIRMPYSGQVHKRNYLCKLLHYPKLLNTLNSKTYLPELVGFLISLANRKAPTAQVFYHAVNPHPIDMPTLLNCYREAELYREDWELVDIIKTKTSRSNCVLKNSIPRRLSPFTKEIDCITWSLKRLKENLDALKS